MKINKKIWFGLGGLLVIGVAFWYFKSQKKALQPAAEESKSSGKSGSGSSAGTSSSATTTSNGTTTTPVTSTVKPASQVAGAVITGSGVIMPQVPKTTTTTKPAPSKVVTAPTASTVKKQTTTSRGILSKIKAPTKATADGQVSDDFELPSDGMDDMSLMRTGGKWR